MKTIAIFHTGRGGRFNNGGHKTFCRISKNGFDAEYYGHAVYFYFENWDYFVDLLSQNDIENDFILDWHTDLNKSNITEEDKDVFNDFCKTHNIDFEFSDLGEIVVFDSVGNKTDCTLNEYSSNKGSIDFDGIYDSYSWCPIDELYEDDLRIILNSHNDYEYLIETNNDNFVDFMRSMNVDEDTIISMLCNEYGIDKLIEWGYITVASEEDENSIEFGNVKYVEL